MENREELNVKIENLTSSMYLLSRRYEAIDDMNIKMKTACQLENRTNILRILAERLATQTREARNNA